MAATHATQPPSSSLHASRVASIDIVRGAIMVLMALDHVRVYSGIPAGGAVPAVFLTRWITNFCAPGFFLLAGTSAYLKGAAGGGSLLSRWLVTRGAVLVLLELTFLRFAWTFNFEWAYYMIAGVIWALGLCMILLAGVVRLPMRLIVSGGLALILGHNAIGPLLGARLPALLGSSIGPLLRVLYFGGSFALGTAPEPNFFVLYSLVPWLGVMCVGYALGQVMSRPDAERRRWLVLTGAASIAAFLVLRSLEWYGDHPWRPHAEGDAWAAPWIMFLATTKYPASLQFLLMTLGPLFIALGLFGNAQTRLSERLTVFGRVPLFFYLLHIPLIHLVAVAIAAVRTPAALPWLFRDHPVNLPPVPDGYRWELWMLYLVTVGVAIALYWPCRWYAQVKTERRWGWTAYV